MQWKHPNEAVMTSVRHPDVGGAKVPEAVKRWTREWILQHAEECTDTFTRLHVRLRGHFYDMDALPRGAGNIPTDGSTTKLPG
jgi:hypothetical protein